MTNDANVFIGSSNIGDGAGRQLWDMRDGDLRGDRRHLFKIYGFYVIDVPLGNFRWNATAGAFVVAQSGQPWESWSFEPYRSLTTSTSDTATVRRAGRHAPHSGPRAGRSELHTDLPDFGPADGTARAGPVQRRKLTDRLQLPAERAYLDVQPAAELFRSAAIPGGSKIQF